MWLGTYETKKALELKKKKKQKLLTFLRFLTVVYLPTQCLLSVSVIQHYKIFLHYSSIFLSLLFIFMRSTERVSLLQNAKVNVKMFAYTETK